MDAAPPSLARSGAVHLCLPSFFRTQSAFSLVVYHGSHGDRRKQSLHLQRFLDRTVIAATAAANVVALTIVSYWPHFDLAENGWRETP